MYVHARALASSKPSLPPPSLVSDTPEPLLAVPEPLLAASVRRAADESGPDRKMRARRSLAKDPAPDALHPGDEEEDGEGSCAGADGGLERSKGKRKGKKGKKVAAAADSSLWSTQYAPPKPTRGRPTFDGGCAERAREGERETSAGAQGSEHVYVALPKRDSRVFLTLFRLPLPSLLSFPPCFVCVLACAQSLSKGSFWGQVSERWKEVGVWCALALLAAIWTLKAHQIHKHPLVRPIRPGQRIRWAGARERERARERDLDR